jgi:crotonobetainyl-CoA:carnitine CoA-transferase CaiB-like acyl-CoA transferase
VLEEALAEASAAEWVERLRAARIPAGLVNDVAEAVAFAEALGLEPVVALGASRTIASPIGLSATPARYRTSPPALDADTGADWIPRKETP